MASSINPKTGSPLSAVGTRPAVSTGSIIPTITGTPGVGNTLTATLPVGVVGTLQWTRTTKAEPPVKTLISGAVANAVNSVTYVQQQADVGLLVGCDASNQVSPSASVDVPAAVNIGLLMVGPTSGVPGFASNKFYLNAPLLAGAVTYNVGNGSGDTFTPANPTLTAALKSAAFTLTQASVGTSAVNISNAANYENPGAASYVTKNTDASIFTESFANLTAWALGANPPQVSGGRCYGGAGGAGAGMNHSYAVAADDSLRYVIPINISASTSNGLMFGVNVDAVGAVPTAGGVNVVGMYIDQANSLLKWVNLTGTQVVLDGALVRGSYIATLTVDANWISIYLEKTDGAKQYYVRRPRAGVALNNLYLFNGDVNGLTGSSFGPLSARKGFSSIVPRTFGENTAVNGVYTANAAADAGYMIWTPVGFDSTVAYPLVVMFHGDGSDESAFVTDPTYPLMRKALLAAGYIVMSCGTINKSTWGSQTSIDAYFAAWQYAYNQFRITKTAFLGCSMGGIESLNQLAKGKIPDVAAWVGYSPTTSLAKAYATSWTAKINTAYGINGGNPYATATVGYDPLLDAPTAFRNVPMMFAAATDDSVVPKADNTDALVSRVTGVAVEVVSIAGITGGHSYAPSTPVLNQIVAFFDKYAK